MIFLESEDTKIQKTNTLINQFKKSNYDLDFENAKIYYFSC